MIKKERFIAVLETFDSPVTIATWIKRVVKEYPSILKQINTNTNETMTLKTLATSMSLKVSKGEFPEIKVLNCEPYRKVLLLTEDEKQKVMKSEINKDIQLLLIEEKIELDTKKATEADQYRLEEFNSIKIQINRYFSLNFVLHHACSLTNEKKKGKHHPENLFLLTKEHSMIKKDAEKKFSIEEQKAYIKRIISTHMMVDKTIELNLTDEVLEMLLDRLEKVY